MSTDLNRELSTGGFKKFERHLNVGTMGGGGNAKMRTPPSVINQKQTLLQKPDPKKTKSKLKNK